MDDTISRQAAIEEVSKGCEELRGVFKRCKNNLLSLPPAQSEQKTGKWVNDGKGLYKCTACGELWLHWWAIVMPIERMYKEMRFCPHCGAKMERNEDADN